jgi:hypothetical protein
MAIGTLGSSLKQLRDLFDGGTSVRLSDADLLRRYADARDDLASIITRSSRGLGEGGPISLARP